MCLSNKALKECQTNTGMCCPFCMSPELMGKPPNLQIAAKQPIRGKRQKEAWLTYTCAACLAFSPRRGKTRSMQPILVAHLGGIEARGMLLNGHIGEVHVRVADVLFACAVPSVCKSCKATSAEAGKRVQAGECESLFVCLMLVCRVDKTNQVRCKSFQTLPSLRSAWHREQT